MKKFSRIVFALALSTLCSATALAQQPPTPSPGAPSGHHATPAQHPAGAQTPAAPAHHAASHATPAHHAGSTPSAPAHAAH